MTATTTVGALELAPAGRCATAGPAARRPPVASTLTLIADEQLFSVADSPSTASTHSPTHTTVPGDADQLTTIEAVPSTDSPGARAGTRATWPTSSSEVVTTESADRNAPTVVATDAASPMFRIRTTYWKLPPGATATLSGDTPATKSGVPVTVTLTAGEQLFSVSDSSSTASTHSPTQNTVPGDANALAVNVATLLITTPDPSPGTSDASPTSSSDVVITESDDANVLDLVAEAGPAPWFRTATAYSKLPPAATATLSGDTPATKSGLPVTVTRKLNPAVSPPGSRAVTLAIAVPSPTGCTVTMDPDTLAVATPGGSTDTEYDSASPSGSAKLSATSTVAAFPSTFSVCSEMEPRASGALLALAGGGGGGPVPESPHPASSHAATAPPSKRRSRVAPGRRVTAQLGA